MATEQKSNLVTVIEETEKQYWKTKATPQLKNILAELEDVRTNSGSLIITGETGSGKTYSTRLFKKKYPADVFIVTVSASDNLGDLLAKTMDALQIEVVKVTKSTKLRQIALHLKALSANGHKPMLLFDEAEFMKQPALCAFKELYEAVTMYCALVLVGTEQLTQNIEKLRKRNKPGIPQFYRRIKFRTRTLPLIDRHFTDFLADLEMESDLKKWLQKNCDNYGELHDVLVPAMREAERTNHPLTEGLVKMVLGAWQ